MAEPLKIAVVGSGPAGFYAAGHLLTRAGDRDVSIAMIDRLPTPHGLVRSGVAPDHPNIKAVTRVFEKTAGHARFRFYGGVEFGRDVTRDELRARHHVVVYATGTAADRPMGIEGENLAGSVAATDFVGWYNGHPDHADLHIDLSCHRAVVVGNGNVALDVARMLMLSDAVLRVTDAADHAIDALRMSRVKEVVILGRRGPLQASFTNPELLELGELEGVEVVVDEAELEHSVRVGTSAATAMAQRNLGILQGYAARPPTGAPRRLVMKFLRSPVALLGSEHVEAVRLVRNELVLAGDGSVRAQATGEEEVLEAGLVLRAVGYRGVPLPDVPFDAARGTIANERGRVRDAGGPCLGEYVVGWIKRGASGVIGTNKKDAQETVDLIHEDLEAGRVGAPDEAAGDLDALLLKQGATFVTVDGWRRIDRHEQELGTPAGRPRVKLTRLGKMLEVAAAQQEGN